jgi:hypothetical protein
MVRYLPSGIGRRANSNRQSALTGQTETSFYCGFTSAPATNAPAGRALRPTTALTRIANLHRRLRERPVARSEADEYSPIEYGGLPVDFESQEFVVEMDIIDYPCNHAVFIRRIAVRARHRWFRWSVMIKAIVGMRV